MEDKNTPIDPVKLYFKEVNQIKLLTPKKERSLVISKERGNLDARNLLIESNLRLALQLALEFYRLYGKFSLSDYVGMANEALIEAIDTINSGYKTRVSTYAVIIIRQRMIDFMKRNGSILSTPASAYERWKKVNTASQNLLKQLGRRPSSVEIADKLDISVKVVEKLMLEMKRKKDFSLDYPLRDGKEKPLGHFVEDHTFFGSDPSEQIGAVETFKTLRLALKKIRIISSHPNMLQGRKQNPFLGRNLKIFSSRYGLNNKMVPRKLERVGKIFGVTRERVRQIVEEIWEKIEKVLTEEEFSLVFTLLNTDIDQRGRPSKNK